MLKNYYYDILVIIFLFIVIGFFINPCKAESECRNAILSHIVNECSRRKRDVIDADKMATINDADESIFHNEKQKLLSPETTNITSRMTIPIAAGIVSSALKSRQPAVAVAPIIGQFHLARSLELRNDGSRLLSEERGDVVGSGFDMTIEEIEEIYIELFERSPRHSPAAPLDNALKEKIARCCQNVALCIKNRGLPHLKC